MEVSGGEFEFIVVPVCAMPVYMMERMRSIFIVAASALWLFSSACNSRDSESQSKEPSPQETSARASKFPAKTPQKADSRPVIVAFGDSLTQGVSGKSYPAFLQDLLDESGYAYRVENQGVSGDTSTDGLQRVENVLAAKPQIVILEFGGNDGLRGIPVNSTQQNLDEIIAKLKSGGLSIVMAGITLPPNYGPDYVKPFNAMYSDLAKKHKLRFLPFLLSHIYDKPGMILSDGIHPTEAGNRIVAQDVFELIRPLLRKKETN